VTRHRRRIRRPRPVDGQLWRARIGAITILGLLALACEAPVQAQPSPAQDPDPAAMLCIPEPEPGEPLRGRVAAGGWWAPRCGEGLLVAPCELGPACSADGVCSCRCEHDGDCRAMAVGVAEFSGSAARPSECREGRCVWSP
jgi:hypothetical protein